MRTCAPSPRSVLAAASTAARTCASSPSPKHSLGMPTVSPERSRISRPAQGRASAGSLVMSRGSPPQITSSTSAASAAVLHSGPIWSSELAKATSPYRLTAP